MSEGGKYGYCPDCGTGLNNCEIRLKCCKDCKMFFDEEQEIDWRDGYGNPWEDDFDDDSKDPNDSRNI
jgi:hypothetical protein